MIDNSVLVAFGEIGTFAGGLFGVDYSYRIKGTTEIKSNWGIYLAKTGFCIFLVLLIYYIYKYA